MVCRAVMLSVRMQSLMERGPCSRARERPSLSETGTEARSPRKSPEAALLKNTLVAAEFSRPEPSEKAKAKLSLMRFARAAAQ